MAKYNEKYFQSNEMHINNIDDLLDEDEKILWRDKPKKSAFIWSKIINMLPFVILWILIDGAFIFFLIDSGVFSSSPTPLVIFLILFFLIHLAPVWIWLSNIISASAQHKNIEYAFTTKRIIIRSGIIVDIKSIYYIDIQSVNLRVGLIDRMLKVGDIYITGTNATAVLWDIKNPYVITNQLQKIVNDIKTDMYFPNAMRPEENFGYKTKYSNEDKNQTNQNDNN